MQTFNKGDRVKYVGMKPALAGRTGTVQDAYRDYDGERVMVLLDGEDKAWSYDDGDFEILKETYMIEMSAEDATIAVMELTPSEVALIERMIDQFDNYIGGYAPTMSIHKYKKMGQA